MNFDDYEQLSTPSVATNMTAGAIAGVLEHCVMYPLDSVKVKIHFFLSIISIFIRPHIEIKKNVIIVHNLTAKKKWIISITMVL